MKSTAVRLHGTDKEHTHTHTHKRTNPKKKRTRIPLANMFFPCPDTRRGDNLAGPPPQHTHTHTRSLNKQSRRRAFGDTLWTRSQETPPHTSPFDQSCLLFHLRDWHQDGQTANINVSTGQTKNTRTPKKNPDTHPCRRGRHLCTSGANCVVPGFHNALQVHFLLASLWNSGTTQLRPAVQGCLPLRHTINK